MNSTTSNTILVPTYVTSDYIQIVCLVFIFFYGTPLNVYILFKLLKHYYTTKSRLSLLGLNLNVSNLMILFFFVFVKIFWLITYKWMAGLILCKLVQYAKSVSVMISSNVIVCIGLDRLFTLTHPLRIESVVNKRCIQTLVVAWFFALTFSAPQLYVWTLFEVAPNWAQCTDIWTVWDSFNLTTPKAAMSRTLYEAVHLILVFWLPLLIILICYVIILKIVYKSLNGIKLGGSKNRLLYLQQSPRNCETDTNATVCNTTVFMGQRQPLVQCANQKRIKRTKYRTLKVTIVIVVAYISFWLPYNILALWGILEPVSYTIVEDYFYFLYGLIAVNAVVNPLIYYRLSFK